MPRQMRIGAGLALLLWGLVTFSHLPVWASNRNLWGRAIEVSPRLARPNLNYGIALAKDGDREGAVLFLVRAAEAAMREPRGEEVRVIVQHELRWMEAFGFPVCSRPDVQPHC